MKQGRPPLMIIVPWGNEGKREMLSIVDIMVPGKEKILFSVLRVFVVNSCCNFFLLGIFLNVILKFADMYDARAFFPPFYAVITGLLITMIAAVIRQKTMPAMVVPGILAILVSLLSVDNPKDLWRFEIKH